MIKEHPISGSCENDWPVGDSLKRCKTCWLTFYGERDQPICYSCDVTQYETEIREFATHSSLLERLILTALTLALLAFWPLLVVLVNTLTSSL